MTITSQNLKNKTLELEFNEPIVSSVWPPINHISLDGINYSIQDKNAISEIDELKEEIKKLKEKPNFIKIESCPNCGGNVQMDSKNMILKCQYCKKVVFIGTKMINKR